MCGFAGILGGKVDETLLSDMIQSIAHRGPDHRDTYISADGHVGLGHVRLKIIDLSDEGNQPMTSRRLNTIVFNGEIYNYLELKGQLQEYPFKTHSDTEVILASYEKWGESCLERFKGMFSFAIWDEGNKKLFCARDRFGVKPFYYHTSKDNQFLFSSEIKAIHRTGVAREKDEISWASYFSYGLYEHSERTFWKGITSLAPGHKLVVQHGNLIISKWYDLVGSMSQRNFEDHSLAEEEYLELLLDSIKLRFRSDVPVGINLSGGLDSSLLVGLVDRYLGTDNKINAFTFTTNSDEYSEVPWAKKMLEGTKHPHHICRLTAEEVPALAAKIQTFQDEPFGGLPTIAYSKIFESASQMGIKVLLDGQGMDEQWAGYDYYRHHLSGNSEKGALRGPVQGSSTNPLRPGCLSPDFLGAAASLILEERSSNPLVNAQYKDALYTKIPRAMRFNDRISMMYSLELREPFMDHRLFEFAFAAPNNWKIKDGVHKWFLRKLIEHSFPREISTAPKRAVQTPQREWIKGPLRPWVNDMISTGINNNKAWFDHKAVEKEWNKYLREEIDNSFFVWQWVNLGLIENTNGK